MAHAPAHIERSKFQSVIGGEPVDLFELRHAAGPRAAITNYGGRLVSLLVPDKRGDLVDVVLGHASLEAYRTDRKTYFGALVGRYANRIAGARFPLGGRTHRLFANDGPNSLHGGETGFDARVWDATLRDASTLVLQLISPDGEEGYPGQLTVEVVYNVGPDGLQIDYEARTDGDTVLNLTNHAYFNLGGEGSGPIDNHVLSIAADYTTPVGAGLIPTGHMAEVTDTPFDLRHPKRLGDIVDRADPQLALGRGFDHNFVLTGGTTDRPRPVASLVCPATGIAMDLLTTLPGVQFYSGNFLDGSIIGKTGRPYGRRGALCLETQHFPDSPNQPAFPSTLLPAGTTFRSRTVFRFSTTGTDQ